jgi:hypothetical protein
MDKHGLVTDRRTPIEQAMDLFFYAPLGLLMNAEEIVPQLAERGRKQVKLAKMMGQYTVRKGRAQAERALIRLQDLADNQTRAGASAPPSPNGEPTPAVQTPAAVAPPQHNGAAAATLAIPDYDSLSASQVVPRLVSLSAGELDAVRAYESANRGRKTILNKIDQLKS